jgi:tRNA-uridine 2-sulfurtransferase
MRVAVAMSGGVDSSVVAGLMARAGHEVIGITLQLYDHGAATARKGACCAGQDIYDAKRVADRLGIAHYVVDSEERFKKSVISAFADSYAAGETPVPCIACNQALKFGDLLEMARDFGAEAMATGHYVRRLEGPDGAEMHQAVDLNRDQSWFLFATTREQLDFCRLPLGDYDSKA